ncbi:hypothetical protein [Bacillus piscicola]|uniref:hypothetical protein n=1 Tax=Bacillus piscicola TaxID=1632684 RepID=UPI001F092F5B|nr:hypothetical protein [Bacillus piscicola]
MKLDHVYTENNDEIHFDTGELTVEENNPENWSAVLYGVENQRLFTDALRNNTKEHLTFETNEGTMYGLVEVEAFDSAGDENVVNVKGTGHLNGY